MSLTKWTNKRNGYIENEIDKYKINGYIITYCPSLLKVT